MQEARLKRSQGRGIAGGILAFFVLLLTGFLPLSPAVAATPVSASIVVDAASGAVLSQSNADLQTYPASLTKMMTIYLAFEALQRGKIKADTPLSVSALAASQSPTKLGLYPGETITVAQAIRGMIIKSANDAAVVMAEALGGSVEGFAMKMNAKAQALGMTRTYFHNPNGLPDAEQHTTARDLARLAAALCRDFPAYYPMFSETRFTFQGRSYVTHNRFVLMYPGADGLKTGYINASGYNLAASASRNGRRIVGVVLGGRSPTLRDAQMWALLDRGFGTTTPANANNALLLASAPGVVPDLKPADGAVSGEDDTVEDGTPVPLVAATQAVVLPNSSTGAAAVLPSAPSSTASGALPTTGFTAPQAPTSQPPAPALIQLQILQPAVIAAAEAPPAVPTIKPETPSKSKTASKSAGTKAAQVRLAASPPPQLKPILVSDNVGMADGVMSTSASEDRFWGIQVGAYSRYSPARQAAIKAQASLPEGTPSTRIAVDESRGSSGKLYRARLIGLSESEASEACRALKARQLSCLVVQSKLAVAQTQ
jgi:D-alanyl-D-alanine carboxypeptidase